MTDAYNAAERPDIKIAEAAARLAIREDDEVLLSLMRGRAGRAWMFRLLAACHVHQTTFSGDALASAFKEGERNIGLMLENNLLRVCANEFITMMKEAHGRAITDDVRRRRDRNKPDDGPDLSNFVNYDDVGDPDAIVPGAGDAAVERDAD